MFPDYKADVLLGPTLKNACLSKMQPSKCYDTKRENIRKRFSTDDWYSDYSTNCSYYFYKTYSYLI